jgi:hypothetical protein
MQSDIDRKVLRILYNYNLKHRRSPSYDELSTMTGKHSHQPEQILRTLQTERYISWDGQDPSRAVVLVGWEV